MPVANSDAGAECDSFVDEINEYNNKITRDEMVGDTRIVEYICGEGDAPFIKYRLTLEAISSHTPEEFEAATAQEAA